jgi:hypothetical protein
MNTFFKFFSILFVTLAKFGSVAHAEIPSENKNKMLEQEQNEELLEVLLENISATKYQEINDKDPDMSFSN